ncbi:hypothetical protein [Sphingobacterium pedocola]|uniref:Lipoprotein n=1 Tax=Sphingobacterium pedocola TaxID=2082722 RepID=A0ABR9T2S4_9SPHI|nr:hypothetical protein [Sphingobacterium pedocola]MBE8719642.1 hypothetical protein [Sphingobacterium pedocola]
MKKYFLILRNTFLNVLFFSMIVSCNNNETLLKSEFERNEYDFNLLKKEIIDNIKLIDVDNDKNIIVFTVEQKYSKNGNIRYLETISKKMEKLKISKVICSTSLKGNCGKFDEISFQIKSEKFPVEEVISYRFDKCGNMNSFRNEKITFLKINNNWGIYKDKT